MNINEIEELIEQYEKRKKHFVEKTYSNKNVLNMLDSMLRDMKEAIKLYKLSDLNQIDLDKKYYLTNEFYLSFERTEFGPLPAFHVSSDIVKQLEENYIKGFTQIESTFITCLVDEEISLLRKTPSFFKDSNHYSLFYIFENIMNEGEEFLDTKQRFDALKYLLDFVNGTGNFKNEKEVVSENVSFRLNSLIDNFRKYKVVKNIPLEQQLS